MKMVFQLYFVFLKMSLFMFGGGYVLLALAKRDLVEKRGWVTERELLDYYAIGSATPGIIAVNTATFVGHKMAGKAGGIVATLGMTTPAFFFAYIIHYLRAEFMDNVYVLSALTGVRIVVAAMLAQIIFEMGRKEFKNYKSVVIFTVGFCLLFFVNLHIALAFLLSGIVGYVWCAGEKQ